MSKKNKHQDTNRKPKYPLPFPEVANSDDIGYMSDDSIFERLSKLESEKNTVLGTGLDARAWEVEIAYLRREQQIRTTRLERHSQYMKSLPREDDYYYVGFDQGEEETFDQKTLN